jgi:uncharacterized protein (DUF885 family)
MAESIRALADEYFEYTNAQAPTSAHMRGDYRYMDRVEDLSRHGEDAQIARLREFAELAGRFDDASLSSDDLATKETLLWDAGTAAALLETRQAELAVDPTFGLHVVLQVYVPQMSVPEPEHAEKMVAKFEAIAGALDQLTNRFREGVAGGRVPARFAVDKTVSQLDQWLAAPIEDDPLLTAQAPAAFSDEETAAWKGRLQQVVAGAIRPALERQRDFIRDEMGPHARSNEQPGVAYLHDGEVLYARALHRYTTLPMQAGEVHEVGLSQIEKLGDEYREVAGPLLGIDDLTEIYTRLREDPELHHTTAEGVIRASEAAFAKARAAMSEWFGVTPKTDCQVKETKAGAQAFYFPPAEDGTRPGVFFMNVADPTSWATYEVEATAFHEGIPGHHLQIAIAQELGDAVPAFRRHTYIGAYSEGWGLYTERLADEMGLYGSDLDRVGMLSADSMRACRLVVDTGLHALGWSRQRAIDYMAANSPMTYHSIEEEVDRYICYPGQACGYMIGRLEILRIRKQAMDRLRDRFDIAGFHDAVLTHGELPLETLDRVVSEWVASVS